MQLTKVDDLYAVMKFGHDQETGEPSCAAIRIFYVGVTPEGLVRHFAVFLDKGFQCIETNELPGALEVFCCRADLKFWNVDTVSEIEPSGPLCHEAKPVF